MIELNSFTQYLSEYLNSKDFADYGPNGLQVEGNKQVEKVIFSVSASAEAIEKAVEMKADCLVVHHGLFWKFQPMRTLTGTFMHKRIAPLIKNNISLIGYHLPLDAHMEVGNGATLARALGLNILGPFGDYKGMPNGVYGEFDREMTGAEVKSLIEKTVGRFAFEVPGEGKIKTLGIITGGANNEWTFARDQGLDAYLTGEISEYNWHDCKEEGLWMFAAGHHATEKFGIQALMKKVKQDYPSLDCHFEDSKNPV